MSSSFAAKLNRDEYDELRNHGQLWAAQDDCSDPSVAHDLSKRGLLVRRATTIKTEYYIKTKYSYRLSRRGELMLKRYRG